MDNAPLEVHATNNKREAAWQRPPKLASAHMAYPNRPKPSQDTPAHFAHARLVLPVARHVQSDRLGECRTWSGQLTYISFHTYFFRPTRRIAEQLYRLHLT